MIRVKENKKSLKGLKGSYAYSHVDEYRCTKGVDVLKQCNIEVEKFNG